MSEFNANEFIQRVLGGGATGGGATRRDLQDYSEAELRQLWRAERIDEAAWHAELVARGSNPQAATDSIARQKNVGLSTAASTRGQPTASEAAAVNAFRSTAPPPAPPPPPPAPEAVATASAQPFTGEVGPFPQRDIATGATASASRDIGEVSPLPPSDISQMGAAPVAPTGGSPVGPGGRTFEQATGKDYVNQAERDWYLAEAARRRGPTGGGVATGAGATARATGGGTTQSRSSAGGTTAAGGTTSRTGAVSPNSKPGEQELIDAGALAAGPGIYWVPTVGGGWALYREGTKGDYSFSRALNKTELAVAQRESARRQQAGGLAPEGIAVPAQGGDRFFNPETNTVGGAPTSAEGRYIPSFVGNESAEEYGRTGRGTTDPVFGTGKFNAAGDETMTSRPVINGVQIDPSMLSNPGYVAATLGVQAAPNSGAPRGAMEDFYRGLGLMAPARAPTPPGPVLPPEDNSKPTRGEILALQPQTPTPEQVRALEMGQFIPPEEFGYPSGIPQFATGGTVTAGLKPVDEDPNQYKQPQNPTTMSPMQTVFPGTNPLPAGAIGEDFEGNPLYAPARSDWQGQRGGGRGGMGYVNPPSTYAERFRQAYGSPWGSMGPQRVVSNTQLTNDAFMNQWIQQERERLIRQGQFAAADRLRPQNSAFPDRVWPSQGVRAFEGGGQVMAGMQPMMPVPSMAGGGSFMTQEPIVGVGAMSGQPQFVAGEAGPEQIDVTPTAPPMPPMTPFAQLVESYLGTGQKKNGRQKALQPVGASMGGGGY